MRFLNQAREKLIPLYQRIEFPELGGWIDFFARRVDLDFAPDGLAVFDDAVVEIGFLRPETGF